MWNLFNNNSSKPPGSEKTLKDQLLREEVACLRHIHEHTTSLLTSLNSALKSNPSPIVMEQLTQIEDQLFDGLAAIETGGEEYKNFVQFRSLEKINENKFYKTLLEKLECSKQQLNQRLFQLEDQIQRMESNGYHIYCYEPPQSPVMATITQTCLTKYLALNTLHQKIELLLSKQPVNAPLAKKNKVESKELTVLKRKLKDKMFTQAMEKRKGIIEQINTKNAVLQTAVGSIREQSTLLDLENRIFTDADLSFNEIKLFWLSMKKTISSQVLYNANLKHAYRSKSCPSVLQKKKVSFTGKETSVVPACFLKECRKAFPQKRNRWTKIEV